MGEQENLSPEAETAHSFQAMLNEATGKYNNLFACIHKGGVHLGQMGNADYIETAERMGVEIPKEVLTSKEWFDKYSRDLKESMIAASITPEDITNLSEKIEEARSTRRYSEYVPYIKSITDKIEIVFQEMLRRGYTEREIGQ